MKTSPVAIVVATWGNYWSRFGRKFVAAIEAMNPNPSSIVIVGEDIAVPNCRWHRVKPHSSTPRWDWFNEAVEACRSEWVLISSVDDQMLPDGLAGLTLQGDIISIGCLTNGKPEPLPTREQWDNLLDMDQSAIWTGSVYRRSSFLRFPWRRVAYSDWMQWIELRNAGVQISFDPKPRFIHARHTGSNSFLPSPYSDRQIREMKKMLATGKVIPGPEWPPVGDNWGVEPEPSGDIEIAAEAAREMEANRTMKIELGGGPVSKALGGEWQNVDHLECADIRHNLNLRPWPFADESIDDVYSSHCLEHLDDPMGVLNEIARIGKVGCRIEIRVPHPISDLAMTWDHKHVLSPIALINAEQHYPQLAWTGKRRLKLDRIGYAPSILLDEAKRELPFLKGLSDEVIMKWVPRTCHECRFFYTVVENEYHQHLIHTVDQLATKLTPQKESVA